MKPNAFAWLALYGWPVVVLLVFAMRRSIRLPRTAAWMLILPVMFLPANLNLPFAALNKHRIAVLSLAAALGLFHRRELALTDRWRHFPLVLMIVFGIGSLVTFRNNVDPLSFGILKIPGLGIRDAAWITWAFFVDLFLPFAIGQRVFRTERDLRDLLEVLGTCTLIYVPLCLIELRLSPQLSNWVYGYFPHSFLQATRGSGYRPVVFMNHGLSVAMFMFSGLCAALALRRTRTAVRPPPGTRALVVGVVLVLCKSLASITYAVVALGLNVWASTRLRARMIAVIGVLVVAYPTLRTLDIFPVAAIGEAFSGISTQRGASLMFRFEQEDNLLDRAMLRPVFGWGNWGRSRLYSSWGEPEDEWAGYRDVSITDGMWIIWLGTSGFVGLALSISLFAVPLLRYASGWRGLSPSLRELLGGVAVMVALFAVDLLPNAQSDLLPAAYGGALFTLSAGRMQARTQRGAAITAAASARQDRPGDARL